VDVLGAVDVLGVADVLAEVMAEPPAERTYQ